MLPAQVCVLHVLGTRQEGAATKASRWDCPQSKASSEARWLGIPSWPPVAGDGLAGGAKPAASSQRFLEAHVQLHKREKQQGISMIAGLYFAKLFALFFGVTGRYEQFLQLVRPPSSSPLKVDCRRMGSSGKYWQHRKALLESSNCPFAVFRILWMCWCQFAAWCQNSACSLPFLQPCSTWKRWSVGNAVVTVLLMSFYSSVRH